jgi:Recombinational DNA repair protein (RecF pathway)
MWPRAKNILPDAHYDFQVERGPIKKVGPGDTANKPFLRGKTLLDMAAEDYSDPQTQQESKLLMRQLIAYHLGGKPLQSRRVFMELQAL